MKKLVLALLLVSGAALAQTPAPAPTSPSDSALPPETVTSLGYVEGVQQSWRILNGLLAPLDNGEGFPHAQYSQWKDPVCYNVYGLAPAAKYFIERRMKEIAAQVGAPVDRNEGCRPNVTIAFSTDPPATLQSIWKARPWLVPGLGLIRNRVREAMPIQAWYANMIKGADGKAILGDGYEDGDTFFFNAGPISHLESGMTSQIGAVTVVVDTKTIMGMEIGALADYFALITLAEAHFTRHCKEVTSIANLMQKDCAPGLVSRSITDTDIFLLKALYATPDDTMAFIQSARIAGKVRRMLESEAPVEPKK